MRVFVTGASGWIGSAVVPELLAAGHQVVGLARSERSAGAIATAGAEVRRGDLDDLESLRAGAEDADAVIHLAFNHDFSNPDGAGRTERAAVEAFGDVLEGSDRRLLLASGLAIVPGRVVTENDPSPYSAPDDPRGASENLALGFAGRGIHPVALRFAASVHGDGDPGFVSVLTRIAREKGVSGYIGDGSHGWAAVHRSDAAAMVRLALEKAPAGSVVHGVGDEGVPTRDIAEAIGRSLDVPVASVAAEDAADHFGWLGVFFGRDIRASNALTRQMLGWTPTGPGLLEDLAAGHYARLAA